MKEFIVTVYIPTYKSEWLIHVSIFSNLNYSAIKDESPHVKGGKKM
jgi:hypothetical protein